MNGNGLVYLSGCTANNSTLYISYQSTNSCCWIVDLAITFYRTEQDVVTNSAELCHCPLKKLQ